jgi:hypothetical protein
MAKLKVTHYDIPLNTVKLESREVSWSEIDEESRKANAARRREDNIQRAINGLAKATGAKRKR